MILKKTLYILAAMLLFLENMIVGNFAASKERDISKILLSEKVKKILFPFFYIKRVTYFIYAYQIVNCVLFAVTLAGILFMHNGFQRVFLLYWNFEKYYIFCIPLLLHGRLSCINLYGLIRKRRCGINWVPGLLQDLNGEVYQINDEQVTAVRPTDAKGCVFIMLEYRNQWITDVFYKNILRRLLDMNYMLVCIDRFPSNDEEKYKMIMEETMRFFHVCKKPFFYMGCEMERLFETLKIDHIYHSNGMIWLCLLKQKNVMKYISIYLNAYRYEEIMPDEYDVCVLNACMKDAEQNLEDWIKEREY